MGFQSAPVITDGRTGSVFIEGLQLGGFNPRPSSLTGEPGAVGAGRTFDGVSIRARHH